MAEAGLSERQRKPAQRIANVPEAEFDATAERDQPPTASRPGSGHSLLQKADDPRRKLRTLVGERLDLCRRFGLSSLVSLVAEALLVRMGSAVRRHFGEGLGRLRFYGGRDRD